MDLCAVAEIQFYNFRNHNSDHKRKERQSIRCYFFKILLCNMNPEKDDISRLCISKYAAPAYICIDIQIASCNRKKKPYEIRL